MGGLDGVGKGDWGGGRTYFTWRGWRGVVVAGRRRVARVRVVARREGREGIVGFVGGWGCVD